MGGRPPAYAIIANTVELMISYLPLFKIRLLTTGGYQLTREKGAEREPGSPLLSSKFLDIFAPAVAKVYIVSFRTHDDRRPSKFILLADNMKSAFKMAWEHGGADFQSRFDKSTAQVQEMKEGALRVL
jgi:hypothetical protein